MLREPRPGWLPGGVARVPEGPRGVRMRRKWRPLLTGTAGRSTHLHGLAFAFEEALQLLPQGLPLLLERQDLLIFLLNLDLQLGEAPNFLPQ